MYGIEGLNSPGVELRGFTEGMMSVFLLIYYAVLISYVPESHCARNEVYLYL